MLKRVFAGLLTFAISSAATADTLQGYFGFNATAVNFGASYEHRLSDGLGLGGYLLFAGDEEEADVRRVISVAGNSKVHFRPIPTGIDLYVAPGFGMHMIDGLSNADDETALGPSLQLGVLYEVTPRAAVGVEKLTIYNWLNNDTVASIDYLNATVTYLFY